MEVLVRGIPVHYEQVGEGRPILVLHGFGADHRFSVHRYEPLFAARDGWRRIYPDLPGMGQTPGAGWITGPDQVLEVRVILRRDPGIADRLEPGEAPWTQLAVIQTPGTLEAFRAAVKPGLMLAGDWLDRVEEWQAPA